MTTETAMLVDRSRDKLLNAIVYFAENTKYCAKTKLLKLLFLLDVEHFRQTGRSVTGLTYYAWELGPVPVKLYNEIEDPSPDFLDKIGIEYKDEGYGRPTEKVVALTKFDSSHFSRRELSIMGQIASENSDRRGAGMVHLTHAKDGVWFSVWKGGEGWNEEIPYELSLSDAEREHIIDLMQESKEFRENFA